MLDPNLEKMPTAKERDSAVDWLINVLERVASKHGTPNQRKALVALFFLKQTGELVKSMERRLAIYEAVMAAEGIKIKEINLGEEDFSENIAPGAN